MGFSVLMDMPSDLDPMNDQIYRNQYEAGERVDKTDDYKLTEVEVEYGLVDEKTKRKPVAAVKLKFALDGRYIFAVYGDNPKFHNAMREEWESAARNAIEKFAGMNSYRVQLGPRPEDHNRYNMMAEFDRPIEMKEETKVLLRQQEAARQKEGERRKMLSDLGILPALESRQAHGRFQPRSW